MPTLQKGGHGAAYTTVEGGLTSMSDLLNDVCKNQFIMCDEIDETSLLETRGLNKIGTSQARWSVNPTI